MNVYITGPEELLPRYANPGDAGADLRSGEDTIIQPGSWKAVRTGIFMALPTDMVALIHPRSGLALNHGITVLNAPGTIDSGYRGELGVVLYNVSETPFRVFRGDRIAQIVFQKFETPTFVHVEALNDTVRGQGGFGSTGTN